MSLSPNYPLGLLIGLLYTNLRASTVLQRAGAVLWTARAAVAVFSHTHYRLLSTVAEVCRTTVYRLQPGLMAPVQLKWCPTGGSICISGDWWPALVHIFKTFAAFWHSLLRTYSLSSLYCTQSLMSSDFIEQLLHRNKQLQTLITVGLAL